MSIEKYIEDIYFFEVNTKYISSNALKISVISRVRSTSEIADIFNAWDEIYLVFTEKKVNFLILSIKGGKTLLQSFLNNFAWLSAFSGYNIGCKHSLHLEKMSKQSSPAPTVSAVSPCFTIIQVSRTPRHWKFTQHHRTTRPLPSPEQLKKRLKKKKKKGREDNTDLKKKKKKKERKRRQHWSYAMPKHDMFLVQKYYPTLFPLRHGGQSKDCFYL